MKLVFFSHLHLYIILRIDWSTAIKIGIANTKISIFPANSTLEPMLLSPASLQIWLQKEDIYAMPSILNTVFKYTKSILAFKDNC